MAIELHDVTFAYPGRPVLDRVSLSLPEAGALCLFGPSGCGKTTVLRLLARLEKPQDGRITGLDGLRTAVVFQENRLLPWLSVLDNVAAVCGGRAGRTHAASCLEDVGLADAAQLQPAALSGGMKRRAAIARALACDADLLLLDEPFTGLDGSLWQGIASRLLNRYKGRPIVLVTHIEAEAQALDAPILRLTPAPQAGRLQPAEILPGAPIH